MITPIENCLILGDYVRHGRAGIFMEKAVTVAKMAVNHLLDRIGQTQGRIEILDSETPNAIVLAARWLLRVSGTIRETIEWFRNERLPSSFSRLCGSLFPLRGRLCGQAGRGDCSHQPDGSVSDPVWSARGWRAPPVAGSGFFHDDDDLLCRLDGFPGPAAKSLFEYSSYFQVCQQCGLSCFALYL